MNGKTRSVADSFVRLFREALEKSKNAGDDCVLIPNDVFDEMAKAVQWYEQEREIEKGSTRKPLPNIVREKSECPHMTGDASCSVCEELRLLRDEVVAMRSEIADLKRELRQRIDTISRIARKNTSCAACGGCGSVRRPGTEEYIDCHACDGKGC